MQAWPLMALVCSLGLGGAAQEHNWVVGPPLLPVDSPNRVHHLSGQNISLNCPVAIQGSSKRRVHWEVKRCSEPCGEWSPAHCRGCRATLVLRNVSENDSGMYRCRDKHSVTIAVFSVDVVDSSRPPGEPKVTPTNLTVLEGEPAVLHCHVSSEQYVELRWFRLQDGVLNSSKHIQYKGASYKPLKNTGQVLRPEGYYTKFSTVLTSTRDSGYYMCVALTAMHHSTGGTYLFVLPASTPGADVDPVEDSWHLHLLFLIPAALALLPAMVWLSCLCRRCCRRSPQHAHHTRATHTREHFQYRPVVNTSTAPCVCGIAT